VVLAAAMMGERVPPVAACGGLLILAGAILVVTGRAAGTIEV
jgi:drug/metabolite transporter (DMT)-like permease